MRLLNLMLAAATLFTVTSAYAATTTITETETGTITGAKTIDTLGLFGAKGAELAGKTMTVHMQYVPAYFGAVTDCRTHACTLARTLNDARTPGAVLVSITVGSTTITYSSNHYGQVLFGKSSPYVFDLYADTQDFGLGYNGVRVTEYFNMPVTFGNELSPLNPPAIGDNADFMDFFQPGGTLPGETLNFLVKSATP